MKVLFLGPSESPVLKFLASVEHEVISTIDPVDVAFVSTHVPDFIVSYGYRHIIRKPILDRFVHKAVNLHISYLPWNRGADPNFWSFVENTPKGVTIHYLNAGVDSGDIIAQKKVSISSNETLRSSYEKLCDEIQGLFRETWPAIRSGQHPSSMQTGAGSFHRLRDKDALIHLLENGWDTQVSVLEKFSKNGTRIDSGRIADSNP